MSAYSTYQEYKSYGGVADENAFNRLWFDADKHIDNLTMTLDGVRKLRKFPPTDSDTLESLKRCECRIIDILFNAETVNGFVVREDGSVSSKQVASVSSGSESITFSKIEDGGAYGSSASGVSAIDAVIRQYLSGLVDANGVNLLYAGVYPCV